jgi:hypothetical protein
VDKLEKGIECIFTFYYYPEYNRNPLKGNVNVDLRQQDFKAKFIVDHPYQLRDQDKEYILKTVLRNLEL